MKFIMMNIVVLVALVFIPKITAEADTNTVPAPGSVPEKQNPKSPLDTKFLIQLGRNGQGSFTEASGNQLKRRTAPLIEENDNEHVNKSDNKPAVDVFEVIPVVDGVGNTYLLSPDDFSQLRQHSIIIPLEENDEVIVNNSNGTVVNPGQQGNKRQVITATRDGRPVYIQRRGVRRGGRPGVRGPLRRRPIRRRGALQGPVRRRSPLQGPNRGQGPNNIILRRRNRLRNQRRRQIQRRNQLPNRKAARRRSGAQRRRRNQGLNRRRINIHNQSEIKN